MNVHSVGPEMAQEEVGSVLDDVEQRLLALIREGSHAATHLDAVVEGLAELIARLRLQYARVQEAFDLRDLTFERTSYLQEVRRRALWLYRKCRLEMIFFAKLRAERVLRDALYRQVVETYEELSVLEEAERLLHRLSEDELAARLLQDQGTSLTPPQRLVD